MLHNMLSRQSVLTHILIIKTSLCHSKDNSISVCIFKTESHGFHDNTQGSAFSLHISSQLYRWHRIRRYTVQTMSADT